MEKQRLLIVAILQHHSGENVSTEELYLTDIILLECRSRLADLLVVLESLSFVLLVPLRPVEAATKLKRLFLVFRPVFPNDWHFCLLDKDSSCRSTGRVICSWTLLLRALEAGALFGATVQTLQLQACLVDTINIDN